MKKHVDLRHGLPRDITHNMGILGTEGGGERGGKGGAGIQRAAVEKQVCVYVCMCVCVRLLFIFIYTYM